MFFSLARILIVSIIILPLSCFSQETLRVGTGIGPKINQMLFPVYQDFEQLTQIKLSPVRLKDLKPLDEDKNWYAKDGKPINIINGQASRRIFEYYKQGKIIALNDLWQKLDLDNSLSSLKSSVTYNGQILGIPFAMQSWQIYYFKSFLGDDFSPPETLDDLVKECKRLSAQDIIPFHIVTKEEWLQMAWFEYLILRTPGLEYFNKLMTGQLPFNSPEVAEVLALWATLIEANCFSDSWGDLAWRDIHSFFGNKKFAFAFVPGTLAKIISEKHRADLDFFVFPKINDIPRYESVPLFAYLINSNDYRPEATFQFLSYMLQDRVQAAITQPLGNLPANPNAIVHLDNALMIRLSNHVKESAGSSAFMDRLLLPGFEIASRPYFNQFIKDADQKTFMEKLEFLRLQHYGKLTK